MRIGSLCAGYGGLEEGVRSVLGGQVAWQSEIDPGACKILAHRYPGVPNIGDMTAINWADVEPVDVLCGGTPCQDLSAAGKRAGMTEGTRSNLWVAMREAIAQLRPSLVVWENVRGAYSARADSELESREGRVGVGGDGPVLRALGRVLGDLSSLGYDASWHGLRAADVGAPHGRFRVFVTAWPAADAGRLRGDAWRLAAPGQAEGRRTLDLLAGRGGAHAADAAGEGLEGGRPGGSRPERSGAARSRGDAAPHSEGDGRHEGRPESARLIGGSDAALGGDDAAAYAHGGPIREQPVTLTGCVGATVAGHAGTDAAPDPDRDGLEGLAAVHGPESSSGRGHADGLGVEARGVDWGQYGPAVRRWERCLGRPAPQPTERGKNGQPRLSPRFVEWMMGLPAGWVCDVPGLTRNEMLKALGNGVCPAQAAAALRLLLSDAFGVAA